MYFNNKSEAQLGGTKAPLKETIRDVLMLMSNSTAIRKGSQLLHSTDDIKDWHIINNAIKNDAQL